jgi:hypothetical protein
MGPSFGGEDGPKRLGWPGRGGAYPSLVLSVACNEASLIGDKPYFIKPRRFSISHDCWHGPQYITIHNPSLELRRCSGA